MAWSGGTFTRVDGATGWQDDEAAGTGIEAGLMDTAFNDLAADGINQTLNKAGQNTPTANLPMGGYKHTGVADATAGDEYLSYKQLLDVSKAVTTAGTSPDFTVSLTPAPTAYYDGMTFMVEAHADVTVTTGATLNVNSLGAKDIKVHRPSNNVRDVHSYEISSGAAYQVTYDSGQDAFILNNPTFGGLTTWTSVIGSSAGTATITSASAQYTYINHNLVLAQGNFTISLSGSSAFEIRFSLPVTASATNNYKPGPAFCFGVSGYANYGATSWTLGTNAVLSRTDQTDWPIDGSMTMRFFLLYPQA